MNQLNSPATIAPAEAIRALFLDIDGTLVGADNLISPIVLHAVRAARAHGCEIVLCTGRTRFRTFSIAEQIGAPLGYAVTSNGGVLTHLGTGEVLYRRLLPVPIALTIIHAIRAAGAEPFVYEDSDRPGIEGARVLYHPEAEMKDFQPEDARYRPHASLMEALPFQPVSVSTYGRPEIMQPLAAHLRQELKEDVSIVQSGTEHNWGVEIYVSGISKRTGLETLAARLDVAQEEIMAVGDHINDLEMIEWAGRGIAMGNALPEVKASADWITATLRDDGVAVAINRFIFGKA